MRIFLIAVFYSVIYFIPFKSFSQNKQSSLQINWSPLNLFDPHIAGVQIGIQKKLVNRVHIAADYLIKMNSMEIFKWNEDIQQRDYFRIKADLRYYYRTSEYYKKKYFIAIESSYLDYDYRRTNGYLSTSAGNFRYTYSDINKNVISYSIKIGREYILFRSFSIETSIGLGIRTISIHHSPNQLQPSKVDSSNFFLNDTYQGKENSIHIPVGIKIGYVIR
jgi:hypothetical protein